MNTSQTMLLNQIQTTNNELLKKIKETEHTNNLLLLNYYKTTNQIILNELKEITRKNIHLEQQTIHLLQQIEYLTK
jgi:hypothetical protein